MLLSLIGTDHAVLTRDHGPHRVEIIPGWREPEANSSFTVSPDRDAIFGKQVAELGPSACYGESMGTKAMIEMLVVLEMATGNIMPDIPARFKVVSAFPPRLVVVQITAEDLAVLKGMRGIAAVTSQPQSLAVNPPLTEGERLFAFGWSSRGQKSGKRPGDGRTWDAPGFLPPGGNPK